MGLGRRINAVVDQEKVVHQRVETVALQPGGVVDHRAVGAQFGHEDPIAQALGGSHVPRIGGQT